MKQKLFCNFGHKILIPDAILKAKPSNYADISGIFSDFFKNHQISGSAGVGYPLKILSNIVFAPK
jgi:hypothetical protein